MCHIFTFNVENVQYRLRGWEKGWEGFKGGGGNSNQKKIVCSDLVIIGVYDNVGAHLGLIQSPHAIG